MWYACVYMCSHVCEHRCVYTCVLMYKVEVTCLLPSVFTLYIEVGTLTEPGTN